MRLRVCDECEGQGANVGPIESVETHPEDAAPVDPALADEVGEEPEPEPSSSDDDKTSS